MSLSTLMVHANDHNKLTHIHVDDLVDIFCRTLQYKEELPDGIILNAGENITMDFSEIRKMVTHEILGRDDILNVPSFILEVLKLNEHLDYKMDNSKTRKSLHWNPVHSLREMIPVMVQNLINYPGTWYRMNKLERQPLITNLKKKFLRPVLSA
jgi:nucleoside-diphosphate-sugar epimerase